MAQFRTSMSFGHDTKPVTTFRESLVSVDFESACKTALFRAQKKLSGRFHPRSVVVIAEMVSE